MCGIETREDLNLTPATDSGCSCCSTDSSAVVSTPAVPGGTAGTKYELEGLTCGHCVQTVETAVSAVQGVESATVELVAAGISSLTVTGDAGMASVQAAVDNAGYTLTGN
ncbi:heavy-metal-associated domain-containing protein [Arthrobacter sp. H35-D1]|uniref:heavy-metal-associated domain-containing protein n=1 Tax=Arthrobacter sp. H35-D1 TaxID=3046202 RepID=UPI0024BA6E87|nr:heavy-metal-associated domain-containing protein [Arthrobacter sp. H35-D1]MDJ0313162.1 heavy-metal-associated domain-containing protein [Arthrobacter sp. H35-D1]